MWHKILGVLILTRFVCSSNYYPYQQQFFAHQSQSLYQGESGWGFGGFHPGVFSRPDSSNGNGGQVVISGGISSIQGSHGGSPVLLPSGGSGVHGGSGGGQIVIHGGGTGIHGGSGGLAPGFVSGAGSGIHGGSGGAHIVIQGGGPGFHGGNGGAPVGIHTVGGGSIHGGNGLGPVFIPSGGGGGGVHGGSFHGSLGWPAYPYPIQFPLQNPVCCDNNLKPSITGWDTSYTVPCGSYNIFPFVTARIRYTAGSHAAEQLLNNQKLPKQSKSFHHYFPFQNSPASSCSWNFHATGCRLKFSCSYLQLPALFQCDENVMEYNDTQKYFKYCGSASRKLYEPLTSDSGQLKVTFRSRSYALPSVINCSVICTPELLAPQTTSLLITEAPPPKPLKFGKCKCGVRRTVSSARIVGGKRTSPGEFPWTVALVKKNSARPFCGGALINNRHILTAAHCVQTRKPGHAVESDIQVLLNEHDVSKVNSMPGGTLRAAVREVIIHPQYDKITYDYDIAVLKLENSIDFERSLPHCKNGSDDGFARMENTFDAQFVPICLPFNKSEEELEEKDGIVTGWGLTQEGGVPANAMMQATVRIFNDSACQGFYETTDKITKQMMCVGHPEGKMDSCVGDSGGPLAVTSNDTYTLAGIVSWGRGCGRPNLPGVYTRMIGLTDWITENADDSIWCQP